MPSLRELIDSAHVLCLRGPADVPIARIVTDSREVGPGDLFACLPGYRSEGGEARADRHDFIPMAVARGASALMVDRDVPPIEGVTIVRVANCWIAAANAACNYHRHPSRELLVVGITGTSGKTSTSYYLESILRAAGHRVARLGTIEYRLDATVLPAGQTTPEAPVLQALLRESLGAGCSAVVMEVSSHALELHRVQGIDFDAAVFTNVSHDHLNFHPDMEHYLRAKGRLFEGLGAGNKRATGIVNVDDPASETILRFNRGGLCTFGVTQRADVSATEVTMSLKGIGFVLQTPGAAAPVRLRHLGAYSVYNALASAAAAHSLGIDLPTIVAGLEATPTVPGRFELIDGGQDFVVAVDYAHKPDALARLLESGRRLQPRRIITVFGCGGDRDRSKRPEMGRIAIEGSDHVVVTSDNPRSEPPDAIIDEILAAVRPVDPLGQRHSVEPDRGAAIRRAIGMAGPRDMVVIAGKGHETYQLVAGRRLDFDDRVHARSALYERLQGSQCEATPEGGRD